MTALTDDLDVLFTPCPECKEHKLIVVFSEELNENYVKCKSCGWTNKEAKEERARWIEQKKTNGGQSEHKEDA